MPELPDLEVIREYLAPRIAGVPISSAQELRPIIMRNLLGGDPADHLVDHAFADVSRQGKFLLLPLESGANSKLAMSFQRSVRMARMGS